MENAAVLFTGAAGPEEIRGDVITRRDARSVSTREGKSRRLGTVVRIVPPAPFIQYIKRVVNFCSAGVSTDVSDEPLSAPAGDKSPETHGVVKTTSSKRSPVCSGRPRASETQTLVVAGGGSGQAAAARPGGT